MKFVIKLLLIGISSFFALRFFPWWVIIVIPVVFNLVVKTKGSGSFFSSFFGIGLAWFVASYGLFSQGAEDFTAKMARVFTLNISGLMFIAITSTLMALVGALAGYSGNALRNIFIKPDKKSKSKYGRPDYGGYSR
jgi:hypothetical protein